MRRALLFILCCCLGQAQAQLGILPFSGASSVSGWLQPATDPSATIVYVSNSGNDSNVCTSSPPIQDNFATSCLTIDHASFTYMATGTANQLLLKRGDTFTNDIFHQPIGCVSGKSAAAPMVVVGAYGSGTARPLIRIDSAHSPFFGTSGGGGCGSKGDNLVACAGVEFYQYTRDPGNGSWTHAEAALHPAALQFLNAFNYLLIEDCKASFFGDNFVVQPGTTGTNFYFNRNVAVDSYALPPAFSQGLYVDGVNNAQITENVFDLNGYNTTLIAPMNCTITTASPAVFTCTGNKLANGDIIYVASSGGGLTGGTGGVGYFVINLSGATFNASLTSGGSAINTSAGVVSPQNVTWGDPSAKVFNHNVYAQYTNGCVIFTGNISTRAAATGIQHRSGGTDQHNLYVQNPVAMEFGPDCSTGGLVNLNVIQEGTDIQQVPLGQATSGRGEGIDAQIHAVNNPIVVKNNVISQVTSSSVNVFGVTLESGTNGASVTNNTICALPTGTLIIDSGSGNTTTPNTTKQADCSGLGLSAPTRKTSDYDASLGGPGTFAHYIAQARLCSRANGWTAAQCSGIPATDYIRAGYGQ